MHFFSGRKAPRNLASVDRKPAFWKYGEMKTTLDLPDDLMREVKIRAVHEHKKLKDVIAELIGKGMAAGKTRAPKLPKPVKLRGDSNRLPKISKQRSPGVATDYDSARPPCYLSIPM